MLSSDPRRAGGCSQVDAGSPSHWIMPCPGCLAPLCPLLGLPLTYSCLVGVNFLFLTSGPLFIFPGRTRLPGDNSDASSPPTGYSRAQLSTALQPPSSPPPIWRRMGRSPSTGSGPMGLDPSRAPACLGHAGTGHPLGCQSGHASVVCILVATQLAVLSVPAPG